MAPYFFYIGTPTGAPPVAPPEIIDYPTVSYPNSANGVLMSVTNGNWTNNPASFTYQWYGQAGIKVGETNNSYVTGVADLNRRVWCEVTAINVFGNNTVESNELFITSSGQPYTTALGGFTVPPNATIGSIATLQHHGFIDLSSNPIKLLPNQQWAIAGFPLVGEIFPTTSIIQDPFNYEFFDRWSNDVSLSFVSSHPLRNDAGRPLPQILPSISAVGLGVGDAINLTPGSWDAAFTATWRWRVLPANRTAFDDLLTYIIQPRDRGNRVQVIYSASATAPPNGLNFVYTNSIFIPL